MPKYAFIVLIMLMCGARVILHAQDVPAPGVQTMTALPDAAFDFGRNIGWLELFARDKAEMSRVVTAAPNKKVIEASCWTGWPLAETRLLKEARETRDHERQPNFFCAERTYDYLRELGMDVLPSTIEKEKCKPVAEAFVKKCGDVKSSFPMDLVGILQYLNSNGAAGQQAIAQRLLKAEAEVDGLRATLIELGKRIGELELKVGQP